MSMVDEFKDFGNFGDKIGESPIDEYISAETNHPNYNISTFFSSEFVLIRTYLAE